VGSPEKVGGYKSSWKISDFLGTEKETGSTAVAVTFNNLAISQLDKSMANLGVHPIPLCGVADLNSVKKWI